MGVVTVAPGGVDSRAAAAERSSSLRREEPAMGGHVRAGDLDVWVEQVGSGPDVLLIGGLGDTVESWQFQLDGLRDRYRLTAFDNRGAGRTRMPDGPATIEIAIGGAFGVRLALGHTVLRPPRPVMEGVAAGG